MSRTHFEDLEIYRLSEELADAAWNAVRGWDRLAQDTVGKQRVRAADSIGANLAEGTGRDSYRDNLRFIGYARGSLYETKHFLRRAHRRNLLTSEQTDRLKPLLDELLPRLNAYRRAIIQRANND